MALVDQVKQVILSASNILSKNELSALDKNARSIKTRFTEVLDRTEGLLRRLIAARDELSKFK